MSCYPCSIGLAAKALLALFIEESNPKFSTILHDKHVKRLFLCQPLLQNLLNSTSISQLMKHLFHGCSSSQFKNGAADGRSENVYTTALS